MRHKRSWIIIGLALLIVALLTSGVALAGPPRQGPVVTPPPNVGHGGGGGQPSSGGAAPANAPPGEQPASGTIQELPIHQMSYQGKLLFDGTPYNGNIDLTFRLYTVEVSGTAIWEETQNVAVNDGLFNVMLGAVTPMAGAQEFRQQLWLGIQPAGAAGELIPRQLLGAVGYAQNVLPGATMVDPGLPGYRTSFYVESHNHPAIYGSSDTDDAVTGEAFTNTNGVVGNAYGIGGIGVVGRHAASVGPQPGVLGVSSSTAPSATGVLGRILDENPGAFSAAVRGINSGIGGDGIGVWGSQNGGGWGVYGTSISGYGVYGYSGSGPGVYGYSSSGDPYTTASVWGETTSSVGVAIHGNGSGMGAGVEGSIVNGSGAIGRSEGYVGVWAESSADDAVHAQTGAADDNYGLYTPDNIWSLNYHLAGAVMQLARNGGSEALEPGDVVVFSGMSAPLANGLRVVQVARAETANSTAVAGVVYSGYNIAVVTAERDMYGRNSPAGREVTLPGPVPPGDYLLIVVQGPAQVKVSGAVNPGDLLSSAGRAGYAARAAEVEVSGVRMALPGTVFGKALETVEAGEKTIYAFVTLQ